MATKTFGSPPPATLEVTPSAEEVQFFAENGFLVVERLTTDEELAWLTELYEHIFAPENAGEPGAPVDRTNAPGEQGEANLSQAFMPELYHPEVLQTTYFRNARRYAAALLQVDIRDLSCWGHMIRKLPGGRDAPWHQDEAYWDPELSYHALGCWLPLHEVTEEMGAMQFIPGSHLGGVRHHTHHKGDAALHILIADDVDPSEAVVCPLPAGGATFHHMNTLHYTAPNTTDRPRLAFPVEFQLAPRPRESVPSRPWVDANRAATGRTPPTGYFADGAFVQL
jgi:ectoine hydroxylase-related dioxygenase (phytanoyl-CoA dioxygenase family)